MNCVQLIGRLTRDIEAKYTNEGTSISKFTVAVDRKFKKQGESDADFINCVAFGKTAEFIEKYFKKGSKIALTGRIQTGSYTNKDNQKVYTTDVVTDGVEFVESRNSSGGGQSESRQEPGTVSSDGFMDVPEDLGDELPFN